MSYYDGGYKGGRGSKGGSGDGHRKIFVGGLSRDTSDDDLRDYFSSFGSVVECMVKRDPNTGQSRGFGFVTFQDSACVDRVVADRNHVLNGKTIDPKRAQARGGVEACRKIFVGGLDPNLPEDTIRDYFGKFGKIDLVEQPMDREKGIKKGFCFITFDSGDAVDLICVNSKHNLGGRDVDVKKATPKDKMAPNQNSRGGMGGRGGGRGGRDGGYGGSWGDSGSQPPYAGYPTAYPDYSAYYAQMGYGSYGQAPQASAYPAADPYSQQYAAAAAAPPQSSTYDYSAWYGPPVPQPVGPVAAQNGGGAVYGSSGDRRYKPY